MEETATVKLSREKEQNSLHQRAKKVFVGGVNSPVRAMHSVGTQPLIIKKGKGSKVWDVQNKSYIDYLLSFGAMILGHNCLSVEQAVKEVSDNGFHFGMTSPAEIELAEIIQQSIPVMEKIRFVNSGTEAVMGAVRLVRGVTNRRKILKFKNSYHGHADYMLVDGGSGLTTLQIPLSKGVPQEFYKQTVVTEYGNYEDLKNIFENEGHDIAAVIVEPVGGNYGVTSPDYEFLNYVRDITRQYESLLIFDEVITGFRFGFGAVADLLGIKPDLICLGKIIGGGLPIGAYGGAEIIMKQLAPIGDVYQASTFAGNPVVMAAGKAALSSLKTSKAHYWQLTRYVDELLHDFRAVTNDYGIKVEINSFRSMFSIKFKKKEIFPAFYRSLLSQGVLFAPSEYESNFISFAHTREDVEETKRVLAKAISKL